VERFLLENMVIGISAGALSCLLGFAIARLITLLPLDVTGGGGTSSMIEAVRPEYFLYAWPLHWL
jgi:hypothetical protein